MEKPIVLKISGIHDEIFWAVIEIGASKLFFKEEKRGGEIVLKTKAPVEDGVRINDQSLEVPESQCEAARKQAYAVRKDKRQKWAQLS